MLKSMAKKTALIAPGYILYSALNSPPQCVEASPLHIKDSDGRVGYPRRFQGDEQCLDYRHTRKLFVKTLLPVDKKP